MIRSQQAFLSAKQKQQNHEHSHSHNHGRCCCCGGGGGSNAVVGDSCSCLPHDDDCITEVSAASAASLPTTSELRKTSGPCIQANRTTHATKSTTTTTTSAAAGDPDSQKNNNVNKRTEQQQQQQLYPKDSLHLCLDELVDASDCFAKAGCFRRSSDCETKAKLVALQLALIAGNAEFRPQLYGAPPHGDSRTMDVLSLASTKPTELADVISSFSSFRNAYIVAEACNYHLAWRQALFKNVILHSGLIQLHQLGTSTKNDSSTKESSGDDSKQDKNNFGCCRRYLNDYCRKYELTSSLVTGLVTMYKQQVAQFQSVHSDEERFALISSLMPEFASNEIATFSKIAGAPSSSAFSCSSSSYSSYTSPDDPLSIQKEEQQQRQTAAAGTNELFLVGMAGAMRMVLARLADVETKCKMYTQLDFVAAKEELLDDPATRAHLKDLKLVV